MIQTDILAIDYKRLYEEQLAKCAEQGPLIASLRNEIHRQRLILMDAPMPDSGHEWLQNLQYKVKSLAGRVKAFESGEKYIDMNAAFKAQLAEKDRGNKKLKADLADAHAETATVRRYWSEVLDDLEKEHKKELGGKRPRDKGDGAAGAKRGAAARRG